MVRPELTYPPNPRFGTGAAWRRVEISRNEKCVSAHLSDTYHEMRCVLRHDGRAVTAINGETIRIPTTSCPAAAARLAQLVGTPLDADSATFFGAGRARDHCTHMLDLAVLAIRHAKRSPGRRLYEATVPDEGNAPVRAFVTRDGQTAHEWLIASGTIIGPGPLAGRPLGSGFARWASREFDESDFEAATILARTWLIAAGRRYETEALVGQSVAVNEDMIGRCFAYSTARAATTFYKSGHVRETAGEATTLRRI